MITFLLNQELRQESELSPNMTVLQYLRTQVQKTGTKEGCGLGDCGACTVVLGEVVEGKLHPTQQAMVDFHGSQCGYCAPGFIMSMFALSNEVLSHRAD